MPLDILIVGAGVCGPALAVLLQGAEPRHTITVIERTPSLRTAGLQIDVKTQGIPVVEKMGLLDAIREHRVGESGMEFVDSKGKSLAQFGINEPGKRNVGLTNEYEIMRGDMVKVWYEAGLQQRAKLDKESRGGGLKYEFGKTITELAQSDEGVDVTFSDGQKARFDLVVAADGQHSRTRRLAFGQDASDKSFKSIGVHAAYYSIPRAEGENSLAKWYHAPQRRMIMTRTGDREMTQVYLFGMKNSEKLRASYKEGVEKQKAAFAETFGDAGWELSRFTRGLDKCDDFYAHELAQIKLPSLSSGRVVLLGDAGYAPSPFSGQGTTLALIGAYVLAGELTRNETDTAAALKAYDEVMKSPITECQKLSPTMLSFFFPSSRLAVSVLRRSAWLLSTFKIVELMQRLMPEEKAGYTIPDYPELKLGS